MDKYDTDIYMTDTGVLLGHLESPAGFSFRTGKRWDKWNYFSCSIKKYLPVVGRYNSQWKCYGHIIKRSRSDT